MFVGKTRMTHHRIDASVVGKKVKKFKCEERLGREWIKIEERVDKLRETNIKLKHKKAKKKSRKYKKKQRD